MIETAKYTITGLVDHFDEQGNIVGQFPIGSEQELPVHIGQKAVEEGNATLIEGSEREVETEDAPEEETPAEDAPETVEEALAGSDTAPEEVAEVGAEPGEVTTDEVVDDGDDTEEVE